MLFISSQCDFLLPRYCRSKRNEVFNISPSLLLSHDRPSFSLSFTDLPETQHICGDQWQTPSCDKHLAVIHLPLYFICFIRLSFEILYLRNRLRYRDETKSILKCTPSFIPWHDWCLWFCNFSACIFWSKLPFNKNVFSSYSEEIYEIYSKWKSCKNWIFLECKCNTLCVMRG